MDKNQENVRGEVGDSTVESPTPGAYPAAPALSWMTRLWQVHWPGLLGLSIALALVASYLVSALQRNQGHLVYALDDAYIHLAIAKNFADHGVWGVTPDAFASSSSSLLWTFALAVFYRLSGWLDIWPLVLNLGSMAVLFLLADRFLLDHGMRPAHRALVLGVLAWLLPVGALVLSGMEHMAHVALTVAFLLSFHRRLGVASLREAWPLLTLAAALPLVRYEGLFLVAAASAWYVLHGRWRIGLALSACALAPVSLYGLYSLGQGWLFLPNSVHLKGTRPQFNTGRQWYDFLVFRPTMHLGDWPFLLVFFVSLLAYALVGGSRGRDARRIAVPLTLAGAIYLHAMFGSAGWLYRYEAYLVGAGLLVWAALVTRHLPPRVRLRSFRAGPVAAASLALVLMAAPLIDRAYYAHERTSWASTNIHEQHHQVARFFREYYAGEVVVLNDVGFVHSHGGVRGIDLMGLTTMEIARARLENRFDTDFIRTFSQESGARVALVYDVWFGGGQSLPAEWSKAGVWAIRNNVVAGAHAVTFYAVDPAESEPLMENLRAFGPKLPPHVQQMGPYLGQP